MKPLNLYILLFITGISNSIGATLKPSSGNLPGNAANLFGFVRLCITKAPLPVTLMEFKGQEVNKNINLVWKTGTETDLNHYEVERSRDGVHFETVAIVF